MAAANVAPPEPGARPPEITGTRSDSWTTAWRAGAWAACREFTAQASAAALGLFVRGQLQMAAPAMRVASAVGAALAMGLMARRATVLAAAAAGRCTPARDTATRLAAALLPAAALTTALTLADDEGEWTQAIAYLVGKLVQRSARDTCSQVFAGVLPSCEVVGPLGEPVSKQDLASTDWGRALACLLPAAGFFCAQEFLAPSPGEAAAASAQGSAHLMAVGCVEAARALSGTLATAAIAHWQGRSLRAKAAGGLTVLGRNLSSHRTLRHIADAAAMRQHFGVVPDMVAVVRTAAEPALGQAGQRVLRAGLKALGELRAPLVTRGRIGLDLRAVAARGAANGAESGPVPAGALAPSSPAEMFSEASGVVYHADGLSCPHALAPPPSAAPPARGHRHFPAAPESPTGGPHA